MTPQWIGAGDYLPKKLVFMILVFVIDSDFEDIMDVLYIAAGEKDQSIYMFIVHLLSLSTYKVNTFCQTGARVLYSV